jgi:hypothetical protein
MYGAASIAPNTVNCCITRDFGTLGSNFTEFASTDVLCENGRIINVVWQDVALTGKLPKTFKSLTALEELRINRMPISGNIPNIFGSGGLSKLRILMLDYLQLTGEIPGTLAKLTTLTSLLLSGNLLSGNIPTIAGTLDELTLDGNNFKGPVPVINMGTQAAYCALNPGNDKLCVKSSAPLPQACIIGNESPIAACN